MFVLVAFLLFGATQGKVYDRCELARELKFVHNAADHQLATWVCIAEHESQYNTSIVGHQNGDGSGDHGIFQISDKFWCSPPGKGFACGATCAEFEDDNISDDFLCAQRIYREHKQLSGDGFNAWAVYRPHCKGPKADRYIKDCFNDSESPKSVSTPSPVFAHGFFDTSAGRANKESFLSVEEPAFDPFLNFGPPSLVQSTENPNLDPFLTPKSTFFANNRLFTSTLDPSGDLFFTPPSTTTFRPFIFNSRTTTTTVAPTLSSRPSIFQFGNSLRTTPSSPPTASSRSSVFQFGNNQRATQSLPPTASSRSSIFQFGNNQRATQSLSPTGSSLPSAFQFGNTFRTTTSSPPTASSRSSIFQFGNNLRATQSLPPTASSRSSGFQFGNNLRATQSLPQTGSSLPSAFQFGNTLRTTSSPPTASSRSSVFQLSNTFSSRSDRLFPSSTPNYQTSTVSQAAPVFIINGVKWN